MDSGWRALVILFAGLAVGGRDAGNDTVRGSLFSDVDLDKRIRADHPLRLTGGIVNATLAALSGEFDALYSSHGGESILPVRLLEGEVAVKLLAGVLAPPKVTVLLSGEPFSVDGTLLEAWASTKSFRPKDGSAPPADAKRDGEQDFHGQKRSNDTHASATDPDARLYRKGRGKEAQLCFMGHALMENRNGLIAGAVATRASGHAERLAALHWVTPHADGPRPVTLGGDKGLDTRDFVAELRESNVTPHLAQNAGGRRPAIDGRTTRDPAYAVSLRIRKRIEEAFGWAKTVPGRARPGTAACPGSTGRSPLPSPPTLSCVCQSGAEP